MALKIKTRKPTRRQEMRRALALRNIPAIRKNPLKTSIQGRTSAREKEMTWGKTL